MKIIFLDVDGVLNSMSFIEKTQEWSNPIDMDCVACVKSIVERTGARIVLTSSWRGGWDPDPAKCHQEGEILRKALGQFGLEIYDKTRSLNYLDGTARSHEIKDWMKRCPHRIDSFIIIDDADFGWRQHGLYPYLIHTDYLRSGLTKDQVSTAVDLLNQSNYHMIFRNIGKKDTI